MAFLLPGALLAPLAFLDLGFCPLLRLARHSYKAGRLQVAAELLLAVAAVVVAVALPTPVWLG